MGADPQHAAEIGVVEELSLTPQHAALRCDLQQDGHAAAMQLIQRQIERLRAFARAFASRLREWHAGGNLTTRPGHVGKITPAGAKGGRAGHDRRQRERGVTARSCVRGISVRSPRTIVPCGRHRWRMRALAQKDAHSQAGWHNGGSPTCNATQTTFKTWAQLLLGPFTFLWSAKHTNLTKNDCRLRTSAFSGAVERLGSGASLGGGGPRSVVAGGRSLPIPSSCGEGHVW